MHGRTTEGFAPSNPCISDCNRTAVGPPGISGPHHATLAPCSTPVCEIPRLAAVIGQAEQSPANPKYLRRNCEVDHVRPVPESRKLRIQLLVVSVTRADAGDAHPAQGAGVVRGSLPAGAALVGWHGVDQ